MNFQNLEPERGEIQIFNFKTISRRVSYSNRIADTEFLHVVRNTRSSLDSEVKFVGHFDRRNRHD